MSDDGVYVAADHCNTVYMTGEGYGDIGQNMAEFNPRTLGVEDRKEFLQKVEEVYQKGLTQRESDGLAYLITNEGSPNLTLTEIIEYGVEAQRPEDYGDGFVQMCSGDFDVHIVTAGIESIAEESLGMRLNGNMPKVTGTSLKENGSGLEVERYCAGDKKLQALREEYGVDSLEDINLVALGNSDSNDGPMMQEAPVGIGRGRAFESADVYVENDADFWTRATLVNIASEVLEEGNPHEEGRKFAEIKPEELEEVQAGGGDSSHAEEIIDVYNNIRSEVT